MKFPPFWGVRLGALTPSSPPPLPTPRHPATDARDGWNMAVWPCQRRSAQNFGDKVLMRLNLARMLSRSSHETPLCKRASNQNNQYSIAVLMYHYTWPPVLMAIREQDMNSCTFQGEKKNIEAKLDWSMMREQHNYGSTYAIYRWHKWRYIYIYIYRRCTVWYMLLTLMTKRCVVMNPSVNPRVKFNIELL